jgi:hypothetical protein
MNPGLFLRVSRFKSSASPAPCRPYDGPYMPPRTPSTQLKFFCEFLLPIIPLIYPRCDCREVFRHITQQPLFLVYPPSIARADIPLRLYAKPASKWLPELVLRHYTLFMTTSARIAQSTRLLGQLLKSSASPAQMYKFCYSQVRFVSIPIDRSSAGRRNSVFTVSHTRARRPTAFDAGKHGCSP